MTISSVRPVSDDYKSQVSYSTGTTVWSLIDDSPVDDNTYIYSATGVQGYAVVGLPSVSVSATQRIKQVRVRPRVRMHAASNNSVGWIGLDVRNQKDGMGTNNEKFGTAGTVIIESTGAWRTKPPKSTGSTIWTKSIFDFTQVGIKWYYSYSGHVNLRLTELYVDVDIRDQPTVSGVTITGHNTSTRPTVTWTYNANADNDLEVAYRVKIFSDDQYNAAGFNANTSTPSWDSFERAGGIESLVVGKDLNFGETYKAYVTAAQDFNGSRWFSAWASSSAVTLDATDLIAPSMTVTQDTTVPWYRNIISVIGHYNMLSEDSASFETTVGNWTALTNCSVARTTAQSSHGTASMSMTATGAGTMEAHTTTGSGGFRVNGGTVYNFLASFRTAVTARSCNVGVGWYDRNGTIIGSVTYSSNITDSTSAWTQASLLAQTAPANARYAKVLTRVLSAAGSEVHYVDKVSCNTGGSTTWAPGGYLGSSNAYIKVQWAFSSTGPQNIAPPALWGGGDGLTQPEADGFVVTGSLSSVQYDQTQRYHGLGSIRWDVLDTTSKLYLGWFSTAMANWESNHSMWVVPGKTYTFGIYAKADQSFTSQLNLQCLDKDGTTVGSPTNGGSISITTSWQRFSATITVPAGAAQLRAHLDNSSSVVDREVWVDAAQLVIGSAFTTTELLPTSGTPVAWNDMRDTGLQELSVPSSPGDQVVTVFDHDAPPGYTILYRVQSVAVETATQPDTASTFMPFTYAVTMMDSPGPGIFILRDPDDPITSRRVRVVGTSESIEEESGIFHPLRTYNPSGPGNRPVVFSDYIGGYDGSLKIICDSEYEWVGLKELLKKTKTLFLIWPDFGGTHIRIIDRSWEKVSPRTQTGTMADSIWRRDIDVSYLEVDRPV